MDLLTLITPTNIEQEKENFFSSPTYNPQFEYVWQNGASVDWKNVEDSRTLLYQSILDQDRTGTVKEAQKAFDTKIQENTLSTAKSILKKPVQAYPNPPIESVAEQYRTTLAQFQISDYKVEISEKSGFNFRPNHDMKTFTISRHAQFQYFPIHGTIKQELVHIIRGINGEHNGIRGNGNALPTEEGLACYVQDYKTAQGESSLFQHAAEYAVTEVCLKGSLRDAYTFLRDIGFNKELAWGRAIRHKFGFTDTSQPGDIMKPSMYFYHEQKVRALSDNERLRLFIGKIASEELDQYPEYAGKISQEKIYEFFGL